MPHESREMTFPVLSNHFAEPSAGTAYPDTINPLEKTYENPEEFKGRPQKWSGLKSNAHKMKQCSTSQRQCWEITLSLHVGKLNEDFQLCY